MTRLLHLADTHLGYRQYHSDERRQDFQRAFEAAIEDAIEMEVDAVVHAGDLFHDRRPDLLDLQGAFETLRGLEEAGIPFLGIVGNHEGHRDGEWLDLFADFGLAERLDARGRDVGEATIYGLDHVPQSQREQLEYTFEAEPAGRPLLVAHGLFEPFAHANWNTKELLRRSTVDFEALLLGDNHTPGDAKVDETWVTYPGSTERTSASEREERGYNLIDIPSSGPISISRKSLEQVTRPFIFIDVDLADHEGEATILDRLDERNLEGAVVIVTIEGSGDDITPAAIERSALDSGALVARVSDTRDHRDIDKEVTVHFSDPDQAVDQRLGELGFSEAGLEIDSIVRGEAVDSNVRSIVADRLDALLDDPSAFEAPADDSDPKDARNEIGEQDSPQHEAAETTSPEDELDAKNDGPPETPTPTAGGDEQVSMEDFL